MAMFRKKRASSTSAEDGEASYALEWPSSQRWNPGYEVPRNSLDSFQSAPSSRRLGDGLAVQSPTNGSKRWTGEKIETIRGTEAPSRLSTSRRLADLSHWLETLSEIYMNKLENRARWDPRWLNVTHRERFGGLDSASVTVLDYLQGLRTPEKTSITDKSHLASALESRPEQCQVRIIVVTDLSRFVMGALGELHGVDPEFWFEHLVASGYAASDSHLKLVSAVWMNWAERETRFRHCPLPGVGQRTQWNVARRTHGRRWAHMRWGRLGLLHYLGKKGFYENEIEVRLVDGRWLAERDVDVDKHGLLMTRKRLARVKEKEKEKEKEKKKKEKEKDKEKEAKDKKAPKAEEELASRVKATNVFRAYSTFEALPKNVGAWTNRDLRVMAPEGISYWSGNGADGKKTIILVLDPVRSMRNTKTADSTPSLTFMPRALELESYSDDELWRAAEPEESYLDPPPPLPSSRVRRQLKKEQIKQRLRKARLSVRKDGDGPDESVDGHGIEELGLDADDSTDFTSDDEYDEDYEKTLRAEYTDPKPVSRDRDFARKYSFPTHVLVERLLSSVSTQDLLEDDSLVSSMLATLVLDDVWQLLAEMRMELDQLDNDLTATLYEQLVEAIGNSTRQNLTWLRSALQDLHDWAAHLSSSSAVLRLRPDLGDELAEVNAQLEVLQRRVESTLTLFSTSMGLAQSSLVIDQTSGINKLTELAFFFIPISFITSVFSMQVRELTSMPPNIWTWGVALSAVVVTTYLIRTSLRSPSVRAFVLRSRATIINRFSSSNAGSASRRLNTVGNRAIAKYIFFVICVFGTVITFILLAYIFLFLLFIGVWVGAVVVAIYFIITRWPELGVLISCFLSIPIAVAGMCLTWYWAEELYEPFLRKTLEWVERLLKMFPERWTLDAADDDDLAKEGVNTYARQAIVMAT